MNDYPNLRARFAGPGAKALLVGILVIAFLIPLDLVQKIVDDRRSTRDAAEESIIGPAGGRPTLFGPYLVLPYELRKGKELVFGEVLALADALSLDCSLRTESRSRGIFSAPVFTADLEIVGTFDALAADAAPPGAVVTWGDARLAFELSDLRALRETPVVSWAGKALTLRPDAGVGKAYERSASSRVSVEAGKAYAFTASLKLRGGRALGFLEPAGAVRASLRGDWPSPSFRGYVLPTERSFSKAGFSARWYLPESAQGLPRSFDAQAARPGTEGPLGQAEIEKAAFGVDLLDGVDAYAMSWRAVRYGMLFIIVPFAILFLFELISRSRVHPVQYVLIGLANCVFYLLLLSLSEIAGFAWAYAASALACSCLAAGYAAASLKTRRGLLMAPALALLYAYLYVASGSEDYALLIGSLGLLALLAAAMAATRKVDWYGRKGSPRDLAEQSDGSPAEGTP